MSDPGYASRGRLSLEAENRMLRELLHEAVECIRDNPDANEYAMAVVQDARALLSEPVSAAPLSRWERMVELVRRLDPAAADYLVAAHDRQISTLRDVLPWAAPPGYLFWNTLDARLRSKFPTEYPVPEVE